MPSTSENPEQSWVIGRTTDCDLVIAEPTVSARHCRLIRRGDQYWIEDLRSPNGVFVNGVRIAVGLTLSVKPGDQVTLGRQIAMPWPLAPVASPGPDPGTGTALMSIPVTTPESALPGRIITIGRAPESDKQVDLPIVSWNHARIVFESGRPILEDLGSSNGTAIDRVENRIQRASLDPASDVYLGSYKISASELLAAAKVAIGEAPIDKKLEFRGNSMVIGRDPQCDVPLNYPMISWRHARLTREADGILVEDLGSRNGTFVGGIRVSGKILARPGQEIGLGSYRFQLLEGGELAQRKYHGNLTIEAAEVVVNAPNGQRLIEPVSMTIFPSELVALMGPAGAGKTTLLKALNGYTRPAQGRVLFNGASLYDYYDRFRQQLGYVPQDDIVHPQLTVGEALYFSARLRTDLSDDEIRARTVTVLDQLSMKDKIDTPIGSPERKTLSGGQRKRVNIALELINDTPVLFLDEPTSGLSSYDAESVIELLKNLSKQGKTIITTIHQPSRFIYKQFDDLIMVNRRIGDTTGSMVYFGPAYPDSIQFFNAHLYQSSPTDPAHGDDLSPEMLLSGLAEKTSHDWVRLYQSSRYQRDFVDGRSGKQPSATAKAGGDKPRRHFDFTQWFALVKRNTIVKMRDKTQSAILLLQAPIFAILISLVYQPLKAANGFAELTPKLAGVHFLMVVAAIWFGCNNAARDIVGERTVYKRERMVTLKLGSYVFSKLAVLFALNLFQCVFLLGIVFLTLHLKSNFLLDLLVLVLSALVGAGLGLFISAFSRTTESAIALLPIVLLPIIALGGGMRPIYLINAKYRWITNAIPSRWAFEANLLHETGPDGWKRDNDKPAREYLPDLGDPDQNVGSPQAGPAMQLPQAAFGQMQYRSPVDPRSAAQACENTGDSGLATLPVPNGKPRPVLCSDVAEASIPRYLITWTDKDGGQHTSRAYKKEVEIGNEIENGEAFGEVFKAVSFRHSFRESLIALLAMFAGTVLAVLGILRKRDGDPQ